ncbi:hypothetical protein DB35_26035 [Streptomyces abyssalis]|uniref:PDGLE domain-containing protein n=1 Tax=Streptomyces abyssalis TaxID=933944 RepID=A0A1E7JMU3_9ACTN|nr:energy-coupling factor ABC transporter permease [Streptomyces abyssalis]OEU87024.1 hypothetical protein DB35_26035 [Streptomyces abyssalis]OEU89591.1 hypothetical protein AN215_07530 [Streptomyces abyssalis]
MHVPDGFINAPVSVAAGAVAAGAVAVSLRGARRELGGVAALGSRRGQGDGVGGERTAPLAGLVAAFIFAVQMLNFPVAAGTSGHLLGGALAAILVGPYTGVLCVSVVLLMQGVLFADGGLTALGVNILVMGVVTVLVAYGILRALLRVLPNGRGSVTGASFAAALVSVPASAIAFTGLYAVGGTADVELGKVFAAMTGVHVLIGIGEALITAATVGAVIAVRPDLVYGAREFAARPLEVRTTRVAAPGDGTVPRPAGSPAGAATGSPDGSAAAPVGETAAASAASVRPDGRSASPARTNRGLWLGGMAATVICAGVVSFYASGSPDGLEKVAADNGIDKKAEDHAAKDSPLADYGVGGITDPRLSGGLAGVIGAGATLAAGSSVFFAVRRRREANAPQAAGTPSGASGAGGPSGQEAV